MRRICNVIQITVNEAPISGLQVGAITAPNTVAVCGSETITFTATGGQSWRFYIDGNPAGDRSDNSNFATNTLIDGQVVTVSLLQLIQVLAEVVHLSHLV